MDYNSTDTNVWQSKLQEIVTNTEVVSFLSSISKTPLQLVYNDKNRAISEETKNCHMNVKLEVEQNGGKEVYGWMIFPGEMRFGDSLKGSTWAVFHCNWQKPNGDLVNITLPFDGEYQFFLPDPLRRWDFDKEEGYNSRVSYTKEFIKAKNITHLSPNVTYYTAGPYASRDRVYDKFRRILSMDEILEHIPASMKTSKNGQLYVTEEGKKYMTLKFNVNFNN